jgi:hypothetical protein
MPGMKFFRYSLVMLALSLAGVQTIDAQPATAPSRASANTPTAFMLSYDRLAGAGPEAYVRLFCITDSDDVKLANAEAEFDAEVGIFQKMVHLLWGDDAVNQAIHALGMQSGDDIRSATVTERGDHATVTYADGTAGPMLVKTPAGWRLDTSAFRKGLGMPVSDYVRQLHQMAAIVADVATEIDQKHLRSPDAVAHEIAVKTAGVSR